MVSCHTAEPKPVKQEVNGTVILPPLVLLGLAFALSDQSKFFLRYFQVLKTCQFHTIFFIVIYATFDILP
jgi:hypothetical protein